MLQVLDAQWKDHLASMDFLRQGIHLRGYAQKQPKQEFKREAFELFEQMLGKFKSELVTILARIRIRSEEEVARLEQEQQERQQRAAMQFQHEDPGSLGVDEEAAQVQRQQGGQPAAMAPTGPVAPVLRDAPKVGRNDPCPCGSGKKYKQCHGRLA
jgi:preprotein translocase subunit SecA